VNLIADAIRGDINSFEDGLKSFGKGVLVGTLAQIIPGSQQFAAWGSGGGWQAITGAVSSQLPGVNIPIGDNFMLSFSPSFAMGPEALVFGASASATLYDDVGSLSLGGGLSNTGFQIGGSASYRGVSYYYSYLGGGTTKAQHTGGIGISRGNFSMRFENDVLASNWSKDVKRKTSVPLSGCFFFWASIHLVVG